MDSLSGINAYVALASLYPGSAVASPANLLASELSLSTPGPYSGSSTLVGLSGLGQVLSAASGFQETLQTLQPGTPTAAGGHNFGTDFASLAAEVQSFIDAFNTTQTILSGVSGSGQLGGTAAAANLGAALNTQVQANFANSNSSLATLAQLGIEFQPAVIPGQASKLSLDLETLRSAYAAGSAGAFALLGEAASALSNVAGSFISQSGSQYAALTALTTSPLVATLFGNGQTPQLQANNALINLLAGNNLSGANLQQAVSALNEYTLVANLFG